MKWPGVHTLIVIFAAWLFCGVGVRFYRARKMKIGVISAADRVRAALPWALNFMAAVLVAAAIGWVGLHLTERTLVYVMIGALLGSSAIDLAVAFRYPNATRIKGYRLIAPAITILCGSAMVCFVAFIFSVPGDRLRVDYPVGGAWRVMAGGRTKYTNYHHDNPPAQNYAVDMVSCNGYSEGQPIFAPADGVVLRVKNDLSTPEGNLVVIGSSGGVEIWLAHLQEGSMIVHESERVVRGQRVAACGSTGSAVSAHLHIHAQRGREPIALVFGESGKFLIKNDRFMAQ